MFECVNCETTKMKSNQVINYFDENKKGICFKCISSLEDHLLSIKVFNHMKEESRKNNFKCILCLKKYNLISNICPNHSICSDCVIAKLIMNESYLDELKKCINWTSFTLSNCKNCYTKIEMYQRYYLITCNCHFYCGNCIQNIQSFNCSNCEKIKDREFSVEDKILLPIKLKKRNLNVIMHPNHASQYSLLFANTRSLNVSCRQCLNIIKKVQSVIGIDKVQNYQPDIIDIYMSSQVGSSENKAGASGYSESGNQQNLYSGYTNFPGQEYSNYSNLNPYQNTDYNAGASIYNDQSSFFPNNYSGNMNLFQQTSNSEYLASQGMVNNPNIPMINNFSNQLQNPYYNLQQYNVMPVPVNHLNYAGNINKPQTVNKNKIHIDSTKQSHQKVNQHSPINNFNHQRIENKFQNVNQVKLKLEVQKNLDTKNISPAFNVNFICKIDKSSTKSFSKL